MTNKKNLLLLTLLFFSLTIFSQEKIKIACVGNSVTYGYTIPDREHNSYPAQLQQLLGDKYDVQNFGLSGATLLKKGHRPYWEQEVYKKALDFKAQYVIIHLGLNDTDPRNWPKYRDDFTRDYIDLIQSFKMANPKTKVMICRLTPIFHGHNRFKSGTRDWYWQIQNDIERVAKAENVQLIDLNTPLHNRPDLFPDNLHPTAEGAGIIAQTVFSMITGNYGDLKLPQLFSDHMVLQRNKPIPVWGTANASTKIKVTFNKQVKNTIAGKDGHWEVSFPQMNAGGPYTIKVENEKTNIQFNDVMIGEVWLCSGQSNMAFQLKQATTASTDIPASANSSIRLFNMSETAPTNKVAWNDSVLTQVNQLNYFKPASWEVCTPKSSADFSAIAYYFGAKLQEELDVPIGLIQNAIGGSPAEAWIDRFSLEHNAILVDVLTNWNNNDFVMQWCRTRAQENIENSKNPLQRHPYQPAYLYESGIAPLINAPIAGVIWYQGESNEHNVELYEEAFPAVVKSWRNAWGYDFPFYYVQLSSMKVGRESWGHFRDSQRRMMNVIPNSGMAVSSDVGNENDVHPQEKKPVGERLARWALADTYNLPIVKSGPLFKNVAFDKNKAIVEFAEVVQLKTSDNLPPASFEIAGADKIFYPAKAEINGNKITASNEKISNPVFVRYGWSSFSEGNLINEENLPASTFSSEYETSDHIITCITNKK
ncbi:MAG: GDSL-type esterase/lipase family protein [Dysgonamonadaceae bacterium]